MKNRHKIDGKRMIAEGKGTTYEYIANVLFLTVIHLDGKYFGY